MPKYLVAFTEKNYYEIEVEAISEEDACAKIDDKWHDGLIKSSEAFDADIKDIEACLVGDEAKEAKE